MPEGPASVMFRVPRMAYLVVLFLLFGTVPAAFTVANFHFDSAGKAHGAPGVVSWQLVLMVIPLLAALFVARTATVVDTAGIVVRAPFGSRRLVWDDIRGLSVTRRNVYAVTRGGAIRLPCVTVANLSTISRVSGGRLPELAEPTPKYAPQRRRR